MTGTVILVTPRDDESVAVTIEFDGGGRYLLSAPRSDGWQVGARADVPRERWDPAAANDNPPPVIRL